MKNQLYALCLTVVLCLAAAFSAQAQNNNNDNALIGKAIGAYRAQCGSNFSGQIGGSVETTGICFVQGFIKRVTLFPVIQCHQFPCPLVLVIRLGSVDFDCDGNVLGVNCDNI